MDVEGKTKEGDAKTSLENRVDWERAILPLPSSTRKQHGPIPGTRVERRIRLITTEHPIHH